MSEKTFHYFRFALEPDDKIIKFEIWAGISIGNENTTYFSFDLSREECEDIVNEINSWKNDKNSEQNTAEIYYLDEKETPDSIIGLNIIGNHSINVQLVFNNTSEIMEFYTLLNENIKQK